MTAMHQMMRAMHWLGAAIVAGSRRFEFEETANGMLVRRDIKPGKEPGRNGT